MRDPLKHSADIIISTIFTVDRRVLLFGETGIGKSTLVKELAQKLGESGRTCFCLNADPGSPSFGIPGAVCLGSWQEERWQLLHFEALCSLDAGRFRLPLVSAVKRLAGMHNTGILLVDAPGVVRGVAGAELLTGLVEAAVIDAVLVLVRKGKKVPLANELNSFHAAVYFVEAASMARCPSKRQRSRYRRRLWNIYLSKAVEKKIQLSEVILTGTPPPLDAKDEWQGRQVALLSQQHTLALGEVIGIHDTFLQVRMPATPPKGDQLLIRDASRNKKGELCSSKPFASLFFQFVPPPDVISNGLYSQPTGPRPVVHVGAAVGILVNGLFGDPLLHVRLSNQKRSILFDLGEGSRLPAKIAHQITDVFISHTHFDHISGFLWLLRSRIGRLPPCRLYGPPGLSDHIEGLINGILWDRVGEWGPRFEVFELHGKALHMWDLQAGRTHKKHYGNQKVLEGILRQEALFTVRAVMLDHGTPVLAYSFEHAPQLNIRKDYLAACKLKAGPWIKKLKSHVGTGNRSAAIHLPDGTSQSAGKLADNLLLITPGEKLTYATDLADSQNNRKKLTTLAQGAHTFFCEAAFAEAEIGIASRTGHLTTRACGEIATAAGVKCLVPFHFSKRYENNSGLLYDEIRNVCPQTVVPKSGERTQD